MSPAQAESGSRGRRRSLVAERGGEEEGEGAGGWVQQLPLTEAQGGIALGGIIAIYQPSPQRLSMALCTLPIAAPKSHIPPRVFQHWTGVLVFIRPRNPSVSQESEEERDRTERGRERTERERESSDMELAWEFRRVLCSISTVGNLGYGPGMAVELRRCFGAFCAVSSSACLLRFLCCCGIVLRGIPLSTPHPTPPPATSPTSGHYIIKQLFQRPPL